MTPSAKGINPVLESSDKFIKPVDHVIAPEKPFVSGGAPSPEPEPSKKNSFRNRMIAIGAGVAVLAGAGIGIGVNASNNGEKAPEATASSAPAEPTQEPTTTPAPEVTPSAVPETRVAPDISQYEAMSIAEFSALTSKEQMVFAVGKLVPNIKQFAVDYQSMTDNPNDVLPEGSIDNTAQEIDTQVTYNLRFAFTLTGDDREKFIIAVLRNNNQSGLYPLMESMSTPLFNAVDGKGMGYDDSISIGKASPDMGVLQKDTFQDQFREITATNKDGTVGSINAYYYEIPLPDGNVYKTWIRE